MGPVSTSKWHSLVDCPVAWSHFKFLLRVKMLFLFRGNSYLYCTGGEQLTQPSRRGVRMDFCLMPNVESCMCSFDLICIMVLRQFFG